MHITYFQLTHIDTHSYSHVFMLAFNTAHPIPLLLKGLLLHKTLRAPRPLGNNGLFVNKNSSLNLSLNSSIHAKNSANHPLNNHANNPLNNHANNPLNNPQNNQSNQPIASITTLSQLKQTLETIDHPLRYLSTQLVFSSDPNNPDAHKGKLMVIGEAPGEEEDKQGVPFVGASGKLLEGALNAIGLKRNEEFYVANVVPFRPPANRTPTAEEIKFFFPYLQIHIQLIRPRALLVVGATCYKALFPGDANTTISKVRGSILSFEGIDALVVFHPSYLLRVPSAKKIMWHDMIKLKHHLLQREFIKN